MLSLLVITLAGFVAGVLNAVAGGGTFISFPALVWIGVPPVMANASATLAALPGYISSTWAYRHDLRAEGVLSLRRILVLSVIGGLAGALLLVVTPSDGFMALVPWLLLMATVLFATGPGLLSALRRRGAALGPIAAMAIILAVAIYGGYFNGGLGIILLAAFGLIGFTDLHTMNGLKTLLSAVLSLVSVVTFTAAGLIAWEAALPMAVACAIGGFVGARYARRIRRTDLLRHAITAIGLVMTVLFFVV